MGAEKVSITLKSPVRDVRLGHDRRKALNEKKT